MEKGVPLRLWRAVGDKIGQSLVWAVGAFRIVMGQEGRGSRGPLFE